MLNMGYDEVHIKENGQDLHAQLFNPCVSVCV